MVRGHEVQILDDEGIRTHIAGEDKSVDAVILEGIRIGSRIGTVQGSAAGGTAVHEQYEVGEIIPIDDAGLPHAFLYREFVGIYVGEGLVKIAAGDDIVPGCRFLLQNGAEHFCLGDLALTVVIGLQMEVDEDELFVLAFNNIFGFLIHNGPCRYFSNTFITAELFKCVF